MLGGEASRGNSQHLKGLDEGLQRTDLELGSHRQGRSGTASVEHVYVGQMKGPKSRQDCFLVPNAGISGLRS